MTIRQIVAVIVAIAILGYAFYRFFLYRKKLGPVPRKWRKLLRRHVIFYQRLTSDERRRFEKTVQRFLDEISIRGVNTEVTILDRLLVASSAVIPLFGFPQWRYPNLNEVLLYEGSFNEDYLTHSDDANILGMVGDGAMNRMMILSKPQLRLSFRQSGKKNVGIHEFVHLLDKGDGSVDGIPESLMDKKYVQPWLQLMHREMRAIENGQSDIRDYGAESEAEFLSVASEYFFQRPERFAREHPELYELMSNIFHLQPNNDKEQPTIPENQK